MKEMQTRLDLYENAWYKPGGNALTRLIWYFVNHLIFHSSLFPISFLKVVLLRIFGARVGKGVVIKPSVNIKYPWNLDLGDHCWIGEGAWIDNLGKVTLGPHSCLSQGCLLLCGNHNYRKPGFDLIVGSITLGTGAWVGAKAIVGPGVTVGDHAVLTAGSVAGSDLEPWTIYRGNPALPIRNRSFTNPA